MALKPAHKYSTQILGEMGTVMMERLGTIIGVDLAVKQISNVLVQLGKKDAEQIKKKLPLKGCNAMVPALISEIGGNFIEHNDTKIVNYTPNFSSIKITFCQFGDIVKKSGHTYLCELCPGYFSGYAKFADESIITERKKCMTEGDGFCEYFFTCDRPKDEIDPNTYSLRILLKLANRILNKNKFAMDYVGSFLVHVGGGIAKIIGPDASMVYARSTENAGKKQSQIFRQKLELDDSIEDVAELLKNVLETLMCKAEINRTESGLKITVKRCAMSKNCNDQSEGRFCETFCKYYAKGLLSSFKSCELNMEKSVAGKDGCYNADKCEFVIHGRET
jgi:predicted hydrocarbon binding protein